MKSTGTPSTAGPSAAQAGADAISAMAPATILCAGCSVPPVQAPIVASAPEHFFSGSYGAAERVTLLPRPVFRMTQKPDRSPHETVAPVHRSPRHHARGHRVRGDTARRPVHAAVVRARSRHPHLAHREHDPGSVAGPRPRRLAHESLALFRPDHAGRAPVRG